MTTIHRLIDWLHAVRTDGMRSAWCGHCHARPAMADDCGFFYAEPDGKPICEHCMRAHGIAGER